MKNIIVNAQQMAKKNPLTFEVPTIEELDNIQILDNVKISVGNERFWVKVSEIKKTKVTGTINNDLVFTNTHGLRFGDTITFYKKNIYSIFSDRLDKRLTEIHGKKRIGRVVNGINKIN